MLKGYQMMVFPCLSSFQVDLSHIAFHQCLGLFSSRSGGLGGWTAEQHPPCSVEATGRRHGDHCWKAQNMVIFYLGGKTTT